MLSFCSIKRLIPATWLFLMLSLSTHAYSNDGAVTASTSFLDAIERIRKTSDTDINHALSQLNRLKRQLNDQPIEQQLEYYHLLAEIYAMQGNYRMGKVAAENGLILASSLISPRIIIAKLSYNLGFMLESLGDLATAIEHYEKGLDIAESLEEQKEIAIGLINIGAIYYQTDRLSEALVTINEAALISDNLSDLELKGFVNSELGILYGALAQNDKAIQYYEASYKYYMDAGKPLLAVNNLRNAAFYYWVIDKTDKAIATYQELLSKPEVQQQPEMQFSAHIGLAQIYAHEDNQNYDLAMEHLAKTEELVNSVEQHSLPLQFLTEKASILKELKQYDEALEIVAQALEFMRSKKFNATPMSEAVLLVLRSEIYRITGRFKEAYETYLRIYELNMNEFENRKTQAVAELRLELESQKADLERNLLENKNKIESITLKEAKQEAETKQLYIYIIAIAILIFAFLLLQLLKGQRKLREFARLDALTQVLNRHRFEKLATKALLSAQKRKQPVSLVLIDCDHFKNINDTYGHARGDEVLTLLGTMGNEHFTMPNLLGRFGGEEFVALLPDTELEGAIAQAESFRLQVSHCGWNNKKEHPLSISCGVVSTANTNTYELSELIHLADVKLYQAKESGRNQVCA